MNRPRQNQKRHHMLSESHAYHPHDSVGCGSMPVWEQAWPWALLVKVFGV